VFGSVSATDDTVCKQTCGVVEVMKQRPGQLRLTEPRWLCTVHIRQLCPFSSYSRHCPGCFHALAHVKLLQGNL
jgi:hypothetical protein